jgi:hypothetical protein
MSTLHSDPRGYWVALRQDIQRNRNLLVTTGKSSDPCNAEHSLSITNVLDCAEKSTLFLCRLGASNSENRYNHHLSFRINNLSSIPSMIHFLRFHLFSDSEAIACTDSAISARLEIIFTVIGWESSIFCAFLTLTLEEWQYNSE